MVEFFATDIAGWGAFGGLSILVVVSVVRGWFIPIRTHDRELAQANKRGDEWKETALEGRKTIDSLITANSIVNDFFQKVPVSSAVRDDVAGEAH